MSIVLKTKSAVLSILLLLTFTLQANSRNISNNFSISTENMYYPGDEIKLKVFSYGNYDSNPKKIPNMELRIQVLKIKDVSTFYSKQSSKYELDVLSSDSINLTYLTEEVYSFKKTVKVENRYSYYDLNEVISLDINSKGAYLVKATSGNLVAYCGFLVTKLVMISKAGSNSMLAYVVERVTSKPVSEVSLDFFTGKERVGSGKTSEGLCYQTFSRADKTLSDNELTPLITGTYGDDVVISDPYLFFGYAGSKYSTYIYTEQPVYRTNSEVNFKGIIRKNVFLKYEPVKNKEVEIVIKDSKGTEVYKQKTYTNEMGSFNGTYKIAEEGSLGNYTIYANIDENNSYSAGFEVEQYKKPEFKVNVKTNKVQYYGRDNLKAEIDAQYYFGSPVTDAEVEYNIYKVKYYKPWWKFSEYAWWYEDYFAEEDDNSRNQGAVFVYTGKGKLNSNGKLEINYTISEIFTDLYNYNNENWYRPYYMDFDYRYIVQAKVTDKSRREISGTASAYVTRGGFYLTAKSDKYFYKPGDNVSLEVNAFNFSDLPIETFFEAKIYKTSWDRKYNEPDKEFITLLKGKTSRDGKGIVNFILNSTDADGGYSIEVTALDDKANKIQTSASFYVSGEDNWWYDNKSGGVHIITDKDSYRQGEVCKAVIIVSNPDVTALITTNTDDIITYKTEKIKGNNLMMEFPVTDKYMSNFEINVNYILNGNFVNTSKSVLVIPEEKFLTVTAEPSKLIYMPGESGDFKVRVTDINGNPAANAEVSIGIVDESIYSIKEDNTKDIRKFFYGKKYQTVSTEYTSVRQSVGGSRLITIYEKFNLKSLSDKDLATVKGVLMKKNGSPISNAIIVINEDYQAAVTDYEGNFEFKLPEGEYSIGAYYGEIVRDDLTEIKLKKGQVKNIILYNKRELNEENIYFDGKTNSTFHSELRSERGGMDRMSTTLMMKMTEEQSEIIRDFMDDNVQPDVRTDFRDAIFWSPYAVTDADGYAVVSVKYPDNLTSWRITSRVITEDTKVGQIVSNVITRKDLIIRMETPRFLQENDEVTISTVIHNYLSTEKKTTVKFSGTNIDATANEKEVTVSIPPDTDTRVDWKVKVTQPFGEAVLYAEALTNEESDAVEIKVPLQPSGLKKDISTTADFSDVSKTEIKKVIIPDGTDLRSSSMKFTVDPSVASTLMTALDELTGYPYGCVEQTMSRFLPTIVVSNAFTELNVPLNEKTKKEMPEMVSKGLQRLYSMQHFDGGWGWWANDNTNPYMTSYVVYGLTLAKNLKYDVNENIYNRGVNSIKAQLSNGNIETTTRAYMLYTLAIAGQADKQLIDENIRKMKKEETNIYSESLIAMTLYLAGDKNKAAEKINKIKSRVILSGDAAAYWEGKEFHYRWQDDKVQTTAMVLKALLMINPDSELKDKIVRWLMMQRMGNAWRNTQETALIIFAITDYLKYSGELDPDYNVKVFINNQNVLDKNISREDIYRKSESITIEGSLLKTGENEIRIEKNGNGKVYFSSYTNYYISGDKVKAGEENFRVEREYFVLEKYNAYGEDKITYRKKYFDGSVKSGDEILVKLKVYSKEDNQYFMLEDPLPSGVEIIKDDWSYTIEGENNFAGYPYYYWRWWYADKEVRDNRVTFFATYINKGEYEFSYIMQTQLPGEYTVNPAKGMLMYYPEYSGNTDDTIIRVNDK